MASPPLGLKALNPPPPSQNTVRVRMIDTTTNMTLRASSFIDPVMPGQETISMTTMAFLIENEALGKKAVFDLGARKDYWNSAPRIVGVILSPLIKGLRVDKNVSEILVEKGIPLEEINDVIWSHSHWDHTGNPALFPKSTNLCYGKGTGTFPTYPSNPDSSLVAEDFEGRQCIELDYSDLQIGPFGAHDFYGDGSFYLLDTPGHCPGHIAGLARTTPDTFLFLAGDLCHFAGTFRPSEQVPLPDPIPEVALRGRAGNYPAPCPCSFFTDHHPRLRGPDGVKEDKSKSAEAATEPFYSISAEKGSAYTDPAMSAITAARMRDYFDSDPDVLVCLAHDTALAEQFPTLNDDPEGDLNGWRAGRVKEKLHWGWLGELPRWDEEGRVVGQGCREGPLVEGYWREGRQVGDVEELRRGR